MNRFILPLLAMAFSSPVHAQSDTANGNWDGLHFGFQIGNVLDSSFTRDSFPGLNLDFDGMVGGGQIGYRRQNNAFVYGGEIEFLTGEEAIAFSGTNLVDVRTTTTRIGGQAGYDLGRFLPYATAGIGRMTLQDTIGFGDTSSFGTFGGIGFEFQVGQFTAIGLEAVQQSYSSFNNGNDASISQTNLSFQMNFRY